MKTILLLLKSRFLVVCALFINIMFYSQETLATFQFNNTLVANPAPVPIGSPVLAFKNSSGTVTPAAYENGFWFGWGSRMLYTSENNSNVELTIDTTNKYGITIEWYGELEEGYNEKGTWSVEILKSGVWTTVPNSTMNLQNKPVLIIFPSQDRETKTVTLEPYADNNANLQIRIKASGLNDKIRMDNLIITSRSPKINVLGYNTTNALTQIPVNSPAAPLYGTDFGIVITSSLTATGYADRVFRIENNGAATLNISSINFTGADFSVTGTFPSSINAGSTKDFTVRFNPASDGKSSAVLNIISNANPSPYSYYVEGRGASCKSEDLVFRNNNMEAGLQTLAATPAIGSTFDKITGNSTGSIAIPNSLNTRLYGPDKNTDYNLYTSLNQSWYVRGTTSTVNFGSVDVTNEKGVFISFNLAAFSTAEGQVFNGNDKVNLEVFNTNTNLWSKEIEIVGNGSRFDFTTGSLLEGTYDGDNIPVSGNNASSIKLKILGSSNFTDLAFRITAVNNVNSKRLWLIDDVSVSTANAIYKTYVGGGSGTGWINSANDPTTVPVLEEKAIINAPFIDNLTACECEVLPSKSVSLPSGKLITLEGKLDNKGTFTIESDGNLIQNDNRAVNLGNITVKREIKVGGLRNQYNYLGSPVNFASGESFKIIYPGTTDVLYHSEANNRFYNSSGVNIPGRGLALKEPTGSGISTVTATYKGVPQNGKIILPVMNSNTAVTVLGYNLVGNPYPSNIDLLKLYDINGGKTGASQIASPNISATFYFWDNKANTKFEQEGSGYNGQAYAIFNVLAGENGTGTAAGSLSGGPIVGSKKPAKIVKVGQGFMTRSLKSNYDFLFNNSIRIKDFSAIDFLGKESSGIQDDRYWLHITAPSGITSTIAIVHYAGGNNLFGPEDSRSMGGSDALYSIVESEKISIDGRSSFADMDIISLGTKHFASGEFTIGLDEKEGIFATGQNIYLKDTQTGIITNLSEGNYTFQANAGESTGRFAIIYRPETLLITDNIIKDVILVYRTDDKFIIKSPKSIAMVQVYDLSGKMITALKPNSKEAIVEASYLIKGIYILRINTVDGDITNKKIIKQ